MSTQTTVADSNSNYYASTGSLANDRVLIRQAIDDFAQAMKEKDLDKIMSFYAPDLTAFDLMPPLKYNGIASWRQLWQQSLSLLDGKINSDIRDLNIEVCSDLAVCHGLSHFTLTGGKQDVDTWMRWTGVFKKIDGNWLISHEHLSVPVDMQTLKAQMDLKPEEQKVFSS